MTSSGTHRPHPVDTSGDPLTFALSGLMAEPPGTVREYAIERVDVDPGDGLVLAEPVSGTMRLSRTNRGLVVDARLTTAIAGECARCLRPVVTPVKMRIDEEVLPRSTSAAACRSRSRRAGTRSSPASRTTTSWSCGRS